jgi:predicted enzyme related to lactoylglutathione lyase
MHPDAPSGGGRHRTGEEHPDVTTISGAGTFQDGGYGGGVGGVEVGEGVEAPAGPVEVAGQQPAGIAGLQGVEAGVDLTAEMVLDDLVGVGQILLVRPARIRPSPSHGGAPTVPALTLVLPSESMDIVTAGKQRPKQGDLGGRRRAPIDLRTDIGWRLDAGKQGRLPRTDGLLRAAAVQTEELPEAGAFSSSPIDRTESVRQATRMQSRAAGMWWGTAIAPDPGALAMFYSELLGWPIRHEEPGTVIIAAPEGPIYLVFQEAPGYQAPVWPPTDEGQRPMMHFDFQVGDLDAAVAEAVALGARVAAAQPHDNVRVLFDPAGHPFCLCCDDD